MEFFVTLMLLTSLACSNALPVTSNYQPQCVKVDQCSCRLENVDKPGLIDLHSLVTGHEATFHDQEKSDQTGLVYDFYYNPCLNFSDHGCPEPALCQTGYNASIDLGNLDYVEFQVEGGVVTAIYKSKFDDRYGQNRTTEVTLVCEETAENARFVFISEPVKRHYRFRLITKCACPNGCDTPPPRPSCDQIDSCTCKSTSDSAEIDLHELDNPHAPITAVDNEGYTYYYNPCSGLELQNEIGRCHGVSACQEDPFHKTYYNLGEVDPIIKYNATEKQFIFHYTGGEGGRYFDVKMICDPMAEAPALSNDGDIPKGTLFYPLKLTTKHACTQE